MNIRLKHKAAIYVLLVILGILFFFPFAMMILGSLQKVEKATADPLFWIPTNPTLYNFTYIIGQSSFLDWIKNSLVITLIPVATQIFFGAVLGYIFAKKQFPGREIVFWLMMAVVMVPGQLLIIPKYIMFSQFGWINTYGAIVVPELWAIMGVFLVRQFMMTIPKDLEEAAYIDGAGDFTIFFRIMLPLAKPAIATIGTFAFISCWNDLFTPLIFMTSEEMYPITVGLASLLTKEGNFGIEMAGAAISFVPTFLIFVFFQRYFTEGIAMSGIKS
ncbi:carbohydrate ABC transporter permease [Paenibacillus thiaminolyticus]|uniref:Carbohydrate ABC transporter permease n=1 Tax=Paenibacillus thiaminolyticus TaxID=49283 RepID=A0AAP9J112_PANTH|nr:carbohydrate ABC transporter permease [Paenibacillus thiaminolyticus]MCY9533529.1 carbohydrate ABC transporter permease [Paenibacillus thiaminolyticus]MCY9600751.1 carbohydrate ABC transporter permease [Paenibacillus thiaminolyticus]MCY9607579.1 carbohydrate ABC transporter permease [Paenibacillus thiaminolyticus]MCY9611379.1 carbohydrate ABC transporter permease [Paenibacillus thiaminolyticus]MCY9617350.1 carbohydrate ABC transporter permease [Paenibacillus thiaminolyticus]